MAGAGRHDGASDRSPAMDSRRDGDVRGSRAVRGSLRCLAAIGVLYALLVDLAAFAAVGVLRPRIPWTWDARSTAEAGPLARFDAGWYASIAREGYRWDFEEKTGNIVFFPLYPLLMRALSSLSGLSLFLAGSLVSHLFFFAGLLALAAYLVEDPGRPDPAAVVFSLLAWPWAFFLLAVYTESLFLFLAVSTLLAARREAAFTTLFLGVLAGLTRLSALALVPPLIWLVFGGRRERRTRLLAAALSPALGVGIFLTWLGVRYRDALIFFRAERSGWGRSLASPMVLLDPFSRVFENIERKGFPHAGPLVDLVGPLFLLVALFWLARRRHVAEALYVGAGTLLILMSGNLSSSGRYALVLFPAFRFAAGLLRSPRRWPGPTLAVLSLLLQLYLIARFVNNLWVA